MRTVILDIHADGSMTVMIDGTVYPPDDDQRPWSRAAFPQIIDHASQERAVPVRVEVHEADGTSFTELVAAQPRRADPAPEPAPKTRRPKAVPALIEVTGGGVRRRGGHRLHRARLRHRRGRRRHCTGAARSATGRGCRRGVAGRARLRHGRGAQAR